MATTRDEQIIGLMPTVAGIARNVQRSVPEFAIDDLISEGVMGAMQAVERYDPENAGGASLKTFAATRIRGAMLDHVRDYSFLSRRDYSAQKRGEVNFRLQSIDQPVTRRSSGADEQVTLADMLPDDEDTVARMIDQLAIHAVIEELPEQHRLVILRYYWDGLTCLQIAEENGVTESRISQRLTAARHAAYKLLMDE